MAIVFEDLQRVAADQHAERAPSPARQAGELVLHLQLEAERRQAVRPVARHQAVDVLDRQPAGAARMAVDLVVEAGAHPRDRGVLDVAPHLADLPAGALGDPLADGRLQDGPPEDALVVLEVRLREIAGLLVPQLEKRAALVQAEERGHLGAADVTAPEVEPFRLQEGHRSFLVDEPGVESQA